MSQFFASFNATKPLHSSAQAWIWRGIMACAMFLGGLSAVQSQETNLGRPLEALGDPYNLQNKVVTETQSRIIFYRPLAARQGGSATVYVNGRYHASLVPGGYSPICVAPGPVTLGVRWMHISRRSSKDGFDSITELKLAGGKNQIIRVNDERSKNLELIPINPTSAAKELDMTRLQLHTIKHDGLLAIDLNHDGKINNGSELLGNSTRLADGSLARDGWQALAQYDDNADGIIDAKDAVFNDLRVWVCAMGFQGAVVRRQITHGVRLLQGASWSFL